MKTNNTIRKDISVSEFKEVKNGIWIPIKGKTTHYYTSKDIKFPRPISRDEFKKMTLEEQKFFLRNTKFTAAKLTPTTVYRVDSESIKVNEKIDEKKFTIQFTPGIYVDDQIRQKKYKVPGLNNAK